MKHFKVEVPKGYEIDKENSTFEKIVFKKVNELPKRWKDLKQINGYFLKINSDISPLNSENISFKNRTVFKTEEQAEASIYVAMLTQLRDVYRQGWEPDWSDEDELKHCIYFDDGKSIKATLIGSSEFLSFQSEEIRDLFLENFRDYIEKIKPLYS